MTIDPQKINLLANFLNKAKEAGKKRKQPEGPSSRPSLQIQIPHSPHTQPTDPSKKKQKEATTSTPSEPPPTEGLPTDAPPAEVFRPEFVHPVTGAPVLTTDSVKKSPELGLVIFSGTTLPADAFFPRGVASKFNASMALMLRAGQSMADTYSAMVVVDQKYRTALAEQKRLAEEVDKLKGAVAEAEGRLGANEAEVAETVEELKRKFSIELTQQKEAARSAGLQAAVVDFEPQVAQALEFG